MSGEKSEGGRTVRQAMLMFAEDMSALTAAVAPTVVGYSFFGVVGAAACGITVSAVCILLAAGVAISTTVRTAEQQDVKFVRRLVTTLLIPGFGTYERHKRLGQGVEDEAKTDTENPAI